KTCSACREAKPFEQFARNRSQRDGVDGQCRLCVKVRKAQAYHRKKVIEKSKRRMIAGNRVLDVANLKIVTVLHPLPTGEFDQLCGSVISLLLEGGAA
ncbi:MAG TPA: hypothetical protein VE954_13575, partial [Oligoflexus sp.]